MSGGFGVKFTGSKELTRLFNSLPDKVATRLADKVLIKSAKPIIQDAKAHINVRTGNLKKSIGGLKGRARRFIKGDRTVVIGGRRGGKYKGYHAHLVELGTKYAKPHPFLSPALRRQGRRQHQIVVREMAIGIHSNVNKLALKYGTRKK